MSSFRPIAVIQARMGSKRFPGKMLQEVGGKSLILHAVHFADKLPVDGVYVASPDHEIYESLGMSGHRSFDGRCVSSRYLAIAQQTDATHIVRICGDSPFLDVELATDLICYARSKSSAQHISHAMAQEYGDGIPAIMTTYGVFVEVFRVDALFREFPRMTAFDHEHVTSRFYRDGDYLGIPIPPEIQDVVFKCAVDTPEDLERVRRMYDALGGDIGYRNIAQLVRDRPDEFGYPERYQPYLPDSRVRAEPSG